MKNYVIPIFDFVFDLFQNDIEPILYDIHSKCNENMTIDELMETIDNL